MGHMLRNLLRWSKKRIERGVLMLTSKLATSLIHKSYMHEIEYFEKIRTGSYSDKNYLEAKLRSAAHQVDKGLACGKPKRKEMYAKMSQNLIHNLDRDNSKQTNTIKWAKDVLTEYDRNLDREKTCEKNVGLNNKYGPEILDHIERIIRNRRSVRSFTDKSVDEKLRNNILDMGLWAPSGCNRQNIEYLVLTDKDDIKFCQRMAGEGHSFPQMASFCVVVLVDCRNLSLPSQRHMAYLEAGAAIQNTLLYAHCAGVGSCWLFWAAAGEKNKKFWHKFKLKQWLFPVSMICFGYPKRPPEFVPLRKELKGAIHLAQ